MQYYAQKMLQRLSALPGGRSFPLPVEKLKEVFLFIIDYNDSSPVPRLIPLTTLQAIEELIKEGINPTLKRIQKKIPNSKIYVLRQEVEALIKEGKIRKEGVRIYLNNIE